MIYLDHAATSWPKPPEVMRAMADYLEQAGGNPGRSGHALSIAAGRIVYETREQLAQIFNAPDPLRVVFTLNVTHALNMVLRGYLRPGDHVVTSGMEHNAVMRPLRALERLGVALDVVPCDTAGRLDPADVARVLHPDTRLVVINHASNIVGTLAPIGPIARLAHDVGALMLVDAAQTGGVLPIDMQALDIDVLTFTGHKGLQGPPGTGGLLLNDTVDVEQIEPLVRGGTGSRSEYEEQPDMLPDKYESGTPNGVGLAGLGAALRHIQQRGIEAIRAHEQALTQRLVDGLAAIPGVTVYGPRDAAARTAVISFTARGLRVSELGFRLDEEYGILCRVGLHCAPAAHKTIGTFPEGTVRLAPGLFTSEADIDQTIVAVKAIVDHG